MSLISTMIHPEKELRWGWEATYLDARPVTAAIPITANNFDLFLLSFFLILYPFLT